MDWPFLGSLIALCAVGHILRDVRIEGTALLLLANWVACSGYVAWSGVSYPWVEFACLDYAAGFAIVIVAATLPGRATAWQGAIVAIYAAELLCHAAVGYLESPASLYQGWYFLHYAAWVQVALVASWGVYEMGRRGLDSFRRASAHKRRRCDADAAR